MSGDAPIPTATKDRPVWLRVGTLLDGLGEPLRDAHLVYNSENILHVGPADRPPPAEVLAPGQRSADRVDPEATVLPGLVESHAHLFLAGGELDPGVRAAHLKKSPADLLAEAEPRLGQLIDWGVVAVRDAGDRDGVGLALRRRYLQAGRPPLAYIDSPGAAIHHRGRYGSFMADPLVNAGSPRDCVAARVAAGAARIKLIPTGIINFQKGAVTTEPQMSLTELTEFVAAARSFRKQTFAHASGDAGIDRVIAAGIDSIEHGYFIREDQLAQLPALGIAWVPTFAPVAAQLEHADRMGWDETVRGHLRRILDGHAASLRRAHSLGVQVIAGSDAGSYGVAHGRGFLRELALMEQAGMPSAAVLRAATGVPAGRLGFTERFGRIAQGFRSRFIVTRHSPLETVANLARERTVIFDGVPRNVG